MAHTVRSNEVIKRRRITLAGLAFGEEGVLEQIDLSTEDTQRLMELGFLPGAVIAVKRGSPFGHTRVFSVDGSEIALRRETAACLILRSNTSHEVV